MAATARQLVLSLSLCFIEAWPGRLVCIFEPAYRALGQHGGVLGIFGAAVFRLRVICLVYLFFWGREWSPLLGSGVMAEVHCPWLGNDRAGNGRAVQITAMPTNKESLLSDILLVRQTQ